MSTPIEAIYQDGVFRPLAPVDLLENCRVTVSASSTNGATAEASASVEGSLKDLPHWDEDLAEVYADRLRSMSRDSEP